MKKYLFLILLLFVIGQNAFALDFSTGISLPITIDGRVFTDVISDATYGSDQNVSINGWKHLFLWFYNRADNPNITTSAVYNYGPYIYPHYQHFVSVHKGQRMNCVIYPNVASTNNSLANCTTSGYGDGSVSIENIGILNAKTSQNMYCNGSLYFPANVESGDPSVPRLTVVLDPQTGGGTVSGEGINCNGIIGLSDCSQVYDIDQNVTLTASPNNGYDFLYWDDGCMQSNVNPYTFTIHAAKKVTAKFVQMLTVNVNVDKSKGFVTSDGTINCSETSNVCEQAYHWGYYLPLKAEPKPGYVFKQWEENGQVISTEKELPITVESTRNLTAVFESSPFKWPLVGLKTDRTILLGFGEDWIESCGGEIMKHTGIDIAAAEGEDVYASETGIVKMESLSADWGGWVTLEHNSSGAYPYTTVYFHIIPSVSIGDPVVKGVTPIGKVANYGGPLHLHFGIRNGSYINTSNRGRLPQHVCGGDPAYQENFLDPETLSYE